MKDIKSYIGGIIEQWLALCLNDFDTSWKLIKTGYIPVTQFKININCKSNICQINRKVRIFYLKLRILFTLIAQTFSFVNCFLTVHLAVLWFMKSFKDNTCNIHKKFIFKPIEDDHTHLKTFALNQKHLFILP